MDKKKDLVHIAGEYLKQKYNLKNIIIGHLTVRGSYHRDFNFFEPVDQLILILMHEFYLSLSVQEELKEVLDLLGILNKKYYGTKKVSGCTCTIN
jgi:hypothetical protein